VAAWAAEVGLDRAGVAVGVSAQLCTFCVGVAFSLVAETGAGFGGGVEGFEQDGLDGQDDGAGDEVGRLGDDGDEDDDGDDGDEDDEFGSVPAGTAATACETCSPRSTLPAATSSPRCAPLPLFHVPPPRTSAQLGAPHGGAASPGAAGAGVSAMFCTFSLGVAFSLVVNEGQGVEDEKEASGAKAELAAVPAGTAARACETQAPPMTADSAVDRASAMFCTFCVGVAFSLVAETGGGIRGFERRLLGCSWLMVLGAWCLVLGA